MLASHVVIRKLIKAIIIIFTFGLQVLDNFRPMWMTVYAIRFICTSSSSDTDRSSNRKATSILQLFFYKTIAICCTSLPRNMYFLPDENANSLAHETTTIKHTKIMKMSTYFGTGFRRVFTFIRTIYSQHGCVRRLPFGRWLYKCSTILVRLYNSLFITYEDNLIKQHVDENRFLHGKSPLPTFQYGEFTEPRHSALSRKR